MARRFPDDVLGTLLSTYGAMRCALRNNQTRCGLTTRRCTTAFRSRRSLLTAGATACRSRRANMSFRDGSVTDANAVAAALTTSSRRHYSAAPLAHESPRDVAVLGGGLTGLVTAFYLWRWLPEKGTRITIYEAGDRTGGWIDTEHVRVDMGGEREATVLFERGARVVQTQNRRAAWDDMIFYELVYYLGLQNELRYTHKDARIKRFIYYPDHLVDVTGPVTDAKQPLHMLASMFDLAADLWREPLYKGTIPSVLNMLRQRWMSSWQPRSLAPSAVVEDVSVGQWFATRFGRRDLVDNMLSALVHGVYGGDVWQLSMESSIFSRLMLQEQIGSPGAGRVWCRPEDTSLLYHIANGEPGIAELATAGQSRGYLGFRDGFSTLTNALEAYLRAQPNVTIKLGRKVDKLRHSEHGRSIEVTTEEGEKARHDKVVSTIFARDLAAMTDSKLPTLAESKAVTIQLVNLWYPKADLKRPEHQGFGYLVPATVKSDKNPDGVLGVLFDSDRDALLKGSDADAGTSLTVMMGGRYWDGLPAGWHHDPATAERLAKRAVAVHLGIPADEPAVARTKLCRDCIPQHVVGHADRMARAHDELLRAFGGRLAVAGGSYQAPGVLGSLRAARDIATDITAPTSPDGGWAGGVGATGLARFLPGWRPAASWYQPVSKVALPFRFGNGEVRMALSKDGLLSFHAP